MTTHAREVVNFITATKVSPGFPIRLDDVFTVRPVTVKFVEFGVYIEIRVREFSPFNVSVSIEGFDGDEFELRRGTVIPYRSLIQLSWRRVWFGPMLREGELGLHVRINGSLAASRPISVEEKGP